MHPQPVAIDPLALLQLLQWVSPALPVGAYSYSEGLETLIDQGTIAQGPALLHWLRQELTWGAVRLDAAALVRVHRATCQGEPAEIQRWNQWLSAIRDTEEVRLQHWQMGRSLWQLGLSLESNASDLPVTLDNSDRPNNSDRPVTRDDSDRPGNPDRPVTHDDSDRPDNPDRPNHSDRPVTLNDSDRPDNSDHAVSLNDSDRPNNSDRSVTLDNSDRPGNPDRRVTLNDLDRPDNPDRPVTPHTPSPASLSQNLADLSPWVQPHCNFAIAYGILTALGHLDEASACLGYLQSWASNLISAALRAIPLGQTEGQQLLRQLHPNLVASQQGILTLKDEDLVSCSWGLSLASMGHEVQYSRLFRS
jgi:urease accessory protein UreF